MRSFIILSLVSLVSSCERCDFTFSKVKSNSISGLSVSKLERDVSLEVGASYVQTLELINTSAKAVKLNKIVYSDSPNISEKSNSCLGSTVEEGESCKVVLEMFSLPSDGIEKIYIEVKTEEGGLEADVTVRTISPVSTGIIWQYPTNDVAAISGGDLGKMAPILINKDSDDVSFYIKNPSALPEEISFDPVSGGISGSGQTTKEVVIDVCLEIDDVKTTNCNEMTIKIKDKPVLSSIDPDLCSATGNGSLNDPFEIGTYANFSQCLRNYSSAVFKLTEDIDFQGQTWVSIPVFRGVLDGAGFKLKNLSFSPSARVNGLFREIIDGAVVKSITLDNFQFTSSYHVIGLIAGAMEVAFLSDITVINSSLSATYGAGGLIGQIRRSVDQTSDPQYLNLISTIDSITIINSSIKTNQSWGYTGGVIGYISKGNLRLSRIYVTGTNIICQNGCGGISGGDLRGRDPGMNFGDGYVWYDDLHFLNGSIVTTGAYVGGLLGAMSQAGQITNSSVQVSIDSSNVGVGGFVGSVWGNGGVSDSKASIINSWGSVELSNANFSSGGLVIGSLQSGSARLTNSVVYTTGSVPLMGGGYIYENVNTVVKNSYSDLLGRTLFSTWSAPWTFSDDSLPMTNFVKDQNLKHGL